MKHQNILTELRYLMKNVINLFFYAR